MPPGDTLPEAAAESPPTALRLDGESTLQNQRLQPFGEETRTAAKHPHDVAVVDLASRVCPTGPPCQGVVPAFNPNPTNVTQTVRPDGSHYLPNGSLWVARWLVPQIAEAAKGL
jgi:hypothetical protein